jgi:membrane protein YdbS with pleckstrin-like domain
MPSEETLPPSAATAVRKRSALPRIVNNFVHDMSTGTWAACVLVIWVIASRSRGVPPEAAAVLSDASGAVFWLLVISLVGLTVTGAIRLFYWRSDTPPEQLKTKRGALIVKHVAFLLIYGLGTAWAAWMAFR